MASVSELNSARARLELSSSTTRNKAFVDSSISGAEIRVVASNEPVEPSTTVLTMPLTKAETPAPQRKAPIRNIGGSGSHRSSQRRNQKPNAATTEKTSTAIMEIRTGRNKTITMPRRVPRPPRITTISGTTKACSFRRCHGFGAGAGNCTGERPYGACPDGLAPPGGGNCCCGYVTGQA